MFHVEHWLSFFLVRWVGLRAGGAGGERGYARLSSLLRAKKENQKSTSFARWWRGVKRFFIKANVLFCVPKENQKSTSDFDALDPRERGCSPLSDPEGVVEAQKC